METPFPAIPPMPGYSSDKGKRAETEPERLRRECLEWITTHALINEACARNIMEHCFGVALKLLMNQQDDASKGL